MRARDRFLGPEPLDRRPPPLLLVEVNDAMRRRLPARDSEEFWLAWRASDRTELEEALADVVGVAAFRDGDATARAHDTVFALLVRSLATPRP